MRITIIKDGGLMKVTNKLAAEHFMDVKTIKQVKELVIIKEAVELVTAIINTNNYLKQGMVRRLANSGVILAVNFVFREMFIVAKIVKLN